MLLSGAPNPFWYLLGDINDDNDAKTVSVADDLEMFKEIDNDDSDLEESGDGGIDNSSESDEVEQNIDWNKNTDDDQQRLLKHFDPKL